MVQLDAELLAEARHLLNGANVHRLKEMIFAYEQAIDLHNRRWMGHEIYRMQSEARLRLYVRQRQEESIRQRTLMALERAERAATRSQALADGYDRLEERLREWMESVSGKSNKIA